jgi:hypothetical protein
MLFLKFLTVKITGPRRMPAANDSDQPRLAGKPSLLNE